MQNTIACLFNYWPGRFGLTFQQLIADPYCNWVLGSCGNACRKQQHLDECADSGIVYRGHVLSRAGDWYEWIKL